MTGDSVRSPQIFSCSIAAARNVSPAASITFSPPLGSLAASLPMVVVLPVPLTPTTRMTCGLWLRSSSSGMATGVSTFSISAAMIGAHVLVATRPCRSGSEASASVTRSAVSMPRSAWISTSSRSCSVSSSSLRLVKTPAMWPVSSRRGAGRPVAQALEPGAWRRYGAWLGGGDLSAVGRPVLERLPGGPRRCAVGPGRFGALPACDWRLGSRHFTAELGTRGSSACHRVRDGGTSTVLTRAVAAALDRRVAAGIRRGASAAASSPAAGSARPALPRIAGCDLGGGSRCRPRGSGADCGSAASAAGSASLSAGAAGLRPASAAATGLPERRGGSRPRTRRQFERGRVALDLERRQRPVSAGRASTLAAAEGEDLLDETERHACIPSLRPRGAAAATGDQPLAVMAGNHRPATISPGTAGVDRDQREVFGAAKPVALDQDRLPRSDQRRRDGGDAAASPAARRRAARSLTTCAIELRHARGRRAWRAG